MVTMLAVSAGTVALARQTTAWMVRRNALGAPVHWRFTTAATRLKLRFLYPQT